MTKLLILAYDFPPYVSVGGLRPYSWYRYLKEFGVEPIVVTRNWTNEHGNGLDYIAASPTKETVVEETEWGTVIRTPYKPTLSNRLLLKHGDTKFRLLRKALTACDEIRQFLSVSGPKKELYFAAKKYLKSTEVDAIIATGDPFVLFFYANKLSKKFKTPWIADYRDPWSQTKEFQFNKLYHNWSQRTELKVVRSASHLITVSEFLKQKHLDLFPYKNIVVLPNGYNPDVIDKITQLEQKQQQLTLSFVGTIYNWHPWKSFLTIFSEFAEENELVLNFYGINNSDEVVDFIKRFPLKTQNSIQIFPKIPNEELLQQIAEQNVMLLFNYYSYMGTKIFDYVGVRRKIVFCYGNDTKALELKNNFYNIEEIAGMSTTLQADLIRVTNAGVVVEDEAHLRIVLQDLLQEFEENGQITCNSVGVENYSRKIQVKKLAEIVINIKSK